MQYERIQVTCSEGHPLDEQPESFFYQGRQHLVAGIFDRWYEGGQRPTRPAMYYYKVRTTDGEEFILRYNTLFDAWAVLTGGHGDC